MAKSFMANSQVEKLMDTVFKLRPQDPSTKATGTITKNMARVKKLGQMAPNTLVLTKMDYNMALEYGFGVMAVVTKVTGSMVKCTVKASINGLMA